MVLMLIVSCAISYVTIKVFLRFYYRIDPAIARFRPNKWFGAAAKEGKEFDYSVRPFRVQVADEVLQDLQERLQKTRFEAPLEDAKFNNGFNSNYLREVVKYWKDDYDWRRQEDELNKFPHFKTRIQGLDIHFVRVKPDIPPECDVKVIPILMVHGWPGSFFEFYKSIPLLTTLSPNRDFVFEVVCPSIPGYGFSDSPKRKGFDVRAAAHIFVALMRERLGHSRFFVQGGDWGSFITSVMARFYPDCVLGVHLNMFASRPKGFFSLVKVFVLSKFSFLISKEEWRAFFPIKEKTAFWAAESGYFHIQSTKPDTVGCAMADSPAGLAAYILEKFSTWTDPSHRNLPDGGLTLKYDLEELLTCVMLYWVNNNFTASARFYKENATAIVNQTYEKEPIIVPCGIALFPQELMGMPRALVSSHVKNLMSYTIMPRGGHFAAFQEPKLLADDICHFVEKVQRRYR